jgi:hypothetical protein
LRTIVYLQILNLKAGQLADPRTGNCRHLD